MILMRVAFISQVNIESPHSVSDIFPVCSCLPLRPAVKLYGFLHLCISLWLSLGLFLNIGHTHTHTRIPSLFNWLVVCRKTIFSIMNLRVTNLLSSLICLNISFQLTFLDFPRHSFLILKPHLFSYLVALFRTIGTWLSY